MLYLNKNLSSAMAEAARRRWVDGSSQFLEQHQELVDAVQDPCSDRAFSMLNTSSILSVVDLDLLQR